jgi:glycosyltransferase involved in cell wall biosynthesis
MKVAIITQGKVASGAEIITSQLYSEVKNNVTVLSGSKPVIDFFRDEKFHVEKIDGLSPINRDSLKASALFRVAKSFISLRKVVRQVNPDYIHVYNVASLLYVAISCVHLPIPVILHVHDFYSKDKLNTKIAQMLRNKPKQIVGVSHSICKDLVKVGFPSSSISCIHNGITASTIQERALIEDKNTLTIGFVATISRWKGLHVLLEAAQLLDAKKYSINYAIVGPFVDEGYKKSIMLLADKVKNNKISFLGAKKNARDLMKDFDILVHCSIEDDPFPTVLLEAMYQRCAVIGANGGGVPEIILDNKTGLLHDPGSGKSLAEAIEKLVINKTLRKEIALKGFEEAENEFTIQRFRKEFFDVIKEM